ncbi:iron-containing alcohol dehydrogenase [Clavibacter sp. VKM Ac-2873]|uniref:iron-containing alcohol dehydrogenase family protein n=1 Tax=Clavibacter sp. VKM Ac-2873 TaxID=2783813 RepID=UPI00188CF444|nr:iron-containing alcohol dehydrogenase [Clavibacter sp. VKM Ac-2873]MBF4619275.1 iron-containing alcohol dehydrogenase [Clavibacter sp. VKM Ac-2873]
MLCDIRLDTRIVLGDGGLDDLGALAAGFGTRAVLVTGRHAMRRSGVTARAVASLRRAGVDVTVADIVPPEPRVRDAESVLRVVEDARADVIIGIGGGSVLDVAKACGVAAGGGGVARLVGAAVERRIPVIAVPTTAGSGAEVTTGALLGDDHGGGKVAIRGDAVRPRIALVDPELLAGVDDRTAAATGFDAVAHGIEGLVARRRSPVSDVFATTALQRMAAELELSPDRRDRHRLAEAALFGGLSVATASTGFPHRLQQAMGAVGIELPHGAGLALLYPAWIQHLGALAPDALRRTDDALGGAGATAETVDRLRDGLDLRLRLRDTGVSADDLPRLVAAVTGSVENDPGAHGGPDAMLAILRRSW